jgi:ribonuclease HI
VCHTDRGKNLDCRFSWLPPSLEGVITKYGSGIWVAENNPNNRTIKVPGEKHSNQIAEVAAILAALQQTDPYIPITFVTDSRYAIDGLTKHLPALVGIIPPRPSTNEAPR